MKGGALLRALPVIALTAQQSAAMLAIPPFLQTLGFPLALIGGLVSLGPFLSLSARIPSGLLYRTSRARLLIITTLLVINGCNILYTLVDHALIFALVHSVNGFFLGAATTFYMAFFVEALPEDESRQHAMGYYMGCLATGHSTGGLAAGFIADRLGYAPAFYFAALLPLLCAAALLLYPKEESSSSRKESRKEPFAFSTVKNSLKAIAEPRMANVVMVALFLNILHQIGAVFLPLYGLAVGLNLTQMGIIKSLYALCNAITRPLSGLVVHHLGTHRLSLFGLPVQSIFLMLIPLCVDFTPLLIVYILAGFMRAVVIVSNAIMLVQDVDQTRFPQGLTSGIYNAAGDLGNILGPSLGGVIAALSGIAGLFVMGPLAMALLFLGALQTVKFIPPSSTSGNGKSGVPPAG